MIFYLLSIALYMSAFSVQFSSLKRRNIDNKKLVLALTFAGALMHTVSLYQVMITSVGVDFGFFKVSSMIALFFTVFLTLSAFTKPVENLLLALLPVSVFALTIAQFFPETFTPKMYSTGILAHVIISILAYSIITICATHAVLILLLDRKLKTHHAGGIIWGLPPLQTMERLLWEMLVLGMIGLTLAIATGLLYIDDLFAQHLIHKTTLTILSWTVFATLLIGHAKQGWRGRIAARWTLGGAIILLIAFMGSKFVLELVL